MTRKIFQSIFTVAFSVFLIGLLIILGILYNYFHTIQRGQLQNELAFAAEAVELEGLNYLENLPENKERLTWVAADGTVLYDSLLDPAQMPNHKDRTEIEEALQTGQGTSVRYSDTLLERTSYKAVRLQDGSVLRISMSYFTVLALVLQMLGYLLIVALIAIILSFLFARRMAWRIVQPLNALNLDQPLANDTYDELKPLLERMDAQKKQIKMQDQALKERKREFYTVIQNMEEGLILLSDSDQILSINPAAAAFLDQPESQDEQQLFQLEQASLLKPALDEAKKREHGICLAHKNGQIYQINATQIHHGGYVLLIMDVTEKVQAQQLRQEFTANVTHELKTPLQSIMGSAELIQADIVKEADRPQFMAMIQKEASRLLALIDDIIRLSQLDEEYSYPEEEVDLYQLALEEAASLQPIADQKEIKITVTGKPVSCLGVKQLFYEVMHNLMDNAVKYNQPGGQVNVQVESLNNQAVLQVRDTGIGIPPEHLNHVFERFYRVDKSHSRQTGGTGLGLSIVKHAVQYMNGKMQVESQEGSGTTITLLFEQNSPAHRTAEAGDENGK